MFSNEIIYEDIIAAENLFASWELFRKGKRKRKDVQVYDRHLEDNIFALYEQLKNQHYIHDSYIPFYVNDPKQRHIHKATVRDRLVHQALYSALYPIFDPTFIYDSYSCRNEKGTHRAVSRLKSFSRKSSVNYMRDTYVLKCDIKKFFSSIDKDVLLTLIKKTISDQKVIRLIGIILDSFPDGLPLGNLTSQLFANIYLHELDRYVKQELRMKHYIRYCDDFVIVDSDKDLLFSLIEKIERFLDETLQLQLHPKKVTVRKFSWGIDFLGYVLLPYHIVPRTKTKQRMLKKLNEKVKQVETAICSSESFNQSIQSYLGYLKHANSYKLEQELEGLSLRVCRSNLIVPSQIATSLCSPVCRQAGRNDKAYFTKLTKFTKLYILYLI